MNDVIMNVQAEALAPQAANAKMRKLVDWGMFSVGALSLTIAISGTVLGQFEGPTNTASETATEIVFTG